MGKLLVVYRLLEAEERLARRRPRADLTEPEPQARGFSRG